MSVNKKELRLADLAGDIDPSQLVFGFDQAWGDLPRKIGFRSNPDQSLFDQCLTVRLLREVKPVVEMWTMPLLGIGPFPLPNGISEAMAARAGELIAQQEEIITESTAGGKLKDWYMAENHPGVVNTLRNSANDFAGLSIQAFPLDFRMMFTTSEEVIEAWTQRWQVEVAKLKVPEPNRIVLPKTIQAPAKP